MTLDTRSEDPQPQPTSTTRAPDTWRPLIDWADAAGCLDELWLLVLVCQSERNPEWLGTALHTIATSRARLILGDWSACIPELEPLYTLASQVSITTSPGVPAALPTSVPPERQLRGSLSSAFIIASLIDPAPRARDSRYASVFPEWFDTLRLWMLGQAWIRALRGNYLDQNLKAVADALRHAASREPAWIGLLATLYEPFPAEFESVSNTLRRRAQARLLADELGSAEQRVLRALIRVARNEDAPTNKGLPERDEFRVRVLSSLGDGTSPMRVLPGWEESAGGSELDVELDERADADGARVMSFVGKATETPAQRSITGNTILLRSHEFSQYLPWSWHQLTRPERTAIEEWVESERDQGGRDGLLAAFTWIALATGYSLTQVCHFGLGSDVEGDWQLSTDLDVLFRKPPRPSYRRELPEALTEVLALPASVHRLRLPDWIRQVLAGYTQIPTRKKLGDFWISVTETPSQAFLRVAAVRGFARVTTSMLGHVLGYSLYHRTSDSLLALVGSAHGRTAMPGASAYPSWAAAEVLDRYHALGTELQFDIGPDGDGVNALGSRLRVVDELFCSLLSSAFSGLESQIKQGSLIEQHNAYTTALVIKLFAATGSRPVSDPFESPLHFDLGDHRVYVADKLVVGAEGGRLLPIPKSLSVEIERYFGYLEKLGQLFASSQPAFSAALLGLHESRPPFRLPLFFYLGKEGWESVSEEGLRRSLGSGAFPAPINVFRHRLPVALRARGVDPEVIDGLLGHGYGGCSTYGDWSTRQWNVDMEQGGPALESAFGELALPVLPVPILRAAPEWPRAHAEQDALFGLVRRKREQRKRREAARQQARALIEDWLEERSVGEITAEELAKLERMLVTTPSGTPHVMAHIRYAVLQRYFNMQLRRGTTTLRLRRAYIALNEDAPFTTDLAARASRVVRMLLEQLPILRKAFPPSRATATDALLMASLHLMAESRISNSALLHAVSDPRVVRLVHFRRRYWLEFRPDLEDELEANDATSPCLRLPISRDCAAFLEAGRKPGRKKGSVQKVLGEALMSCHVDLSNVDGKNAIDILASYVDQHNRLTTPGLLAGVLSGRVTACSLDHCDWVRLETGAFLELPGAVPGQAASDQVSLTPAGDDLKAGERDEARSVASQTESRLYFQALRRGIEGADTDRNSKGRREMVSAVSAVVTAFRPRVSSALYLVGEWLCQLVSTVRRLSSIRRYLSGISPAAERVWYDADLLNAEEEEVGELYSALLAARPDIEARAVGLYLRRFHVFARKFGAISDPDWGDLPLGKATMSVRPAYIREPDYLAALDIILASSQRYGQDVVTVSAMVLLLAYRYGLRASEAAGLVRGDWVGDVRPLLLIRNNVIRRLKTSSGRRLVPTLFEHTAAESSLIKRVLVTAEANSGGDMAAPLLGGHIRGPRAVGRLRSIVIQALRRATGNPAVVIHSARHSFATRVLDSMVCIDATVQRSHLDVPVTVTMRAQVLGSAHQSRRTLWGVARLLGHASPITSVGSYSHVVDRWLDDYVDHNVLRRARAALIEGVYDLDAQTTRAAKLEAYLLDDSRPNVSVGSLVRLARLVSRGADHHRSAIALGVPSEIADEMRSSLESVFRGSAKRSERSKSLPELMVSITEGQWECLIEFADEVQVDPNHPWGKVPTASDFAGLLGPQRHIVMWREEHFEWIGLLVKSLRLQKTDFVVFTTSGLTRDQEIWIEEYCLSQFVVTEGSEAQLDTVWTERGRTLVVERAVLVLSRRKGHAVSNRILLTVLAIAWFAAVSIG